MSKNAAEQSENQRRVLASHARAATDAAAAVALIPAASAYMQAVVSKWAYRLSLADEWKNVDKAFNAKLDAASGLIELKGSGDAAVNVGTVTHTPQVGFVYDAGEYMNTGIIPDEIGGAAPQAGRGYKFGLFMSAFTGHAAANTAIMGTGYIAGNNSYLFYRGDDVGSPPYVRVLLNNSFFSNGNTTDDMADYVGSLVQVGGSDSEDEIYVNTAQGEDVVSLAEASTVRSDLPIFVNAQNRDGVPESSVGSLTLEFVYSATDDLNFPLFKEYTEAMLLALDREDDTFDRVYINGDSMLPDSSGISGLVPQLNSLNTIVLDESTPSALLADIRTELEAALAADSTISAVVMNGCVNEIYQASEAHTDDASGSGLEALVKGYIDDAFQSFIDHSIWDVLWLLIPPAGESAFHFTVGSPSVPLSAGFTAKRTAMLKTLNAYVVTKRDAHNALSPHVVKTCIANETIYAYLESGLVAHADSMARVDVPPFLPPTWPAGGGFPGETKPGATIFGWHFAPLGAEITAHICDQDIYATRAGIYP